MPNDEITEEKAIDFLTEYGETSHLRVPCSRWGTTTAECAPVAYRLALAMADATGEPITYEGLDSDMSLVVNDHDDVGYVLLSYGNAEDQELAAAAGFTPEDGAE